MRGRKGSSPKRHLSLILCSVLIVNGRAKEKPCHRMLWTWYRKREKVQKGKGHVMVNTPEIEYVDQCYLYFLITKPSEIFVIHVIVMGHLVLRSHGKTRFV